jgi:hypothetical protein
MHETGVGGQGDHPAVDHFLLALIFDVVVGKRMQGIVDARTAADGGRRVWGKTHVRGAGEATMSRGEQRRGRSIAAGESPELRPQELAHAALHLGRDVLIA